MMATNEIKSMTAEAQSAFDAWHAAIRKREAATLVDPWGTSDAFEAADRAEEAAWDAWNDIASLEDRCYQCGTDLTSPDAGWPFAYCRQHMDSVMVREYDEEL